jgi:outer membrane protein assembly factor BamB
MMVATDAVMCGEALEGILIVGSGDGNILAFNMENGECLYGYGVDQKGAVHCLGINDDKDCIVTGGDSGLALCLNMV